MTAFGGSNTNIFAVTARLEGIPKAIEPIQASRLGPHWLELVSKIGSVSRQALTLEAV